MIIFGIDPGSERTGYGCIDSDGRRHRLRVCGALAAPAGAALPDRLRHIHEGLARLLAEQRPDCVAIENIFHARNVRSALRLGHARGVALLAAAAAGVYSAMATPATEAASSATPRAWPRRSALRTFLAWKMFSMATQSGRCSASSKVRPRWMCWRRSGKDASAGAVMAPQTRRR